MRRVVSKAYPIAGVIFAMSAVACHAQSNAAATTNTTSATSTTVASHAQPEVSLNSLLNATNITLYGLIDASIDSVSNEGGSSSVVAQSGMINGSRWGIKGSENFGDGASALFQLEGGFNIFNGKLSQGGRIFGRQAWVGLRDKKYGTVTLGRQYDPTIWYLATLTGGFEGGTAFAHPFDNDNMGNSFRLDNSVEYASPTWKGLSMRGMYAFSNRAGQVKENRAISAGAGYKNGNLTLGTAFIVIDHVGSSGGGAVDGGDSSGDATFIAGRQIVYGVGASYTYGQGTYGATWTHTQIEDGTSVNLGGYVPMGGADMNLNNFDINALYHVTPAFELLATYVHTMSSFTNTGMSAHPNWNQLDARADYFLTKRADVYLEGAFQHVSGGQGTPFTHAVLCGYTQSSSPSQLVVGVGMRLRF